jgi:hypothetical protein
VARGEPRPDWRALAVRARRGLATRITPAKYRNGMRFALRHLSHWRSEPCVSSK